MKKPEIFLDSSALMAGIVSSQGAARVLLLLAEDEKIALLVSEQVIAEVERNIARKMPRALPLVREMILRANVQILRDPRPEEVQLRKNWISHAADVPILVAAAAAKVGFLATLNQRHFLDDPEVAKRSGLRIGTPGNALAWVRLRMIEDK